MTGGRHNWRSMPISLFDYHLPPELIAQSPLDNRSASRMLVLNRETGHITHSMFADISEWLRAGDLLVLNDTRVIPARLDARRETGGRIEILLVEQFDGDSWRVMARPVRRLREGEHLAIFDHSGEETDFSVTIERKEDVGTLIVSIPESDKVLAQAGQVPLPHYITAPLSDAERYQTVFAREPGSVAAPTAGLHFTEEILEELRGLGVEIAWVTLHVGPGTFQPVKVEDAMQHQMHAERYLVGEDTLEKLRRARQEQRRIIAVGTTSCRTLESISDEIESSGPLQGDTSLYITPGYEFKIVGGLLTNFHLPKSTLLVLVSAFAGRESVLRSYSGAVADRYRFYSFGDAMLIL